MYEMAQKMAHWPPCQKGPLLVANFQRSFAMILTCTL